MNTKNGADREQIGGYRIIEILGRGGMGIVYKAIDSISGKAVALKTVYTENKRQTDSIRREIRSLARINHPGIVRIIDEGIDEKRPWYAMELLKGMTLDRYCSEMVWDTSSFSPHWTFSPDSKRLTESSQGSSQWWIKLLATTEDVDPQEAVNENNHDQPLAMPKPRKEKRLTAAAGHLDTVMRLISRISSALAYLHGKGIVHRDLKPSNIVIDKDLNPIIMDFGLMFEFWGEISREALSVDLGTGGTLLYMAPEQIAGGIVDARADLYSLGCMLYELLTGQLPFIANSVAQIVQAHMNYIPVPPSDLVEGVPAELDKLVMNLLEKKPQDRIGHAQEINAILTSTGIVTSCETDQPRHASSYLYRPRFFGRDNIFERVIEEFSKLKKHSGSIILIGGEGGIGKTRFLLEFMNYVRRRHVQVYSGESLPYGGSGIDTERSSGQAAFQIFKKMFADIAEQCRLQGKKATEKIFSLRRQVLSMYFPELSCLPGQEDAPRTVDLPSDAARLRLFNYLAQTLTALVEEKPAVIFLDDLHSADELTLNFLIFILRTGFLNRIPLMMIGTYRKEAIDILLQRIIDSHHAVVHDLERLSHECVRKIMADMLGKQDISDVFSEYLYRFSEGNPFFIAEYMRAAIEAGFLFRDGKGRWQIGSETTGMVTQTELASLPLPLSLTSLVTERLDLVSRSAWKLAATLSVIGRDINTIHLWNIMPFCGEILDDMDELIRRQIIQEVSPGQLRFVNQVIREIIYGKISPDERATLHLKVAESLAAAGDQASLEIISLLAYHWYQAGQRQTARDCYLKAAEKAAELYALSEAERLYNSYFSMIDEDEESEESVMARNQYTRKVLMSQGKTKQAMKAFEKALETSRKIGSISGEAQNLLGIAYIQALTGQIDDSLATCRLARKHFSRIKDVKGEANTLNNIGNLLIKKGSFDDAEPLIEEAMAKYKSMNDESGEASTLFMLGNVCIKRGQLDSAFSFYERAKKLHKRIGERHLEAEAIKNQAMVYLTKGNLDKALRYAEKSLHVIREIGDRMRESSAIANLALITHEMNDKQKAAELYREAIQLQIEIEDIFSEGATRSNYAHILFELGRIREAKQQFGKAIKLLENAGIRHIVARALHGLAVLERIALSDIEKAECHLVRAREIMEDVNDRLGLVICICEFGHINLAKRKTASEYLEKAIELASDYNLGPDSEITREIEKLRRAQTAFMEGTSLLNGELPEDLTEELRKKLIKG
ncbi:tetratricopeptide repeat protein [bacterium]|nr:tetratricopeptide repeat protein [candidate division CSSED10-310 bacterium]